MTGANQKQLSNTLWSRVDQLLEAMDADDFRDYRFSSPAWNSPTYTMNDLILYTTEDGRSQIKLRAKDQTVWLSQREMAQLFDVTTDNVGPHLKNIFTDGELEGKPVTEESSVTAADGKNYLTKPYNLDAILAVGYRVRQGGHHIDEAVIRRRFSAGRLNLDQAYKPAVDTWAEYDNVGEEPTLLQWGENR